MVAQMTIVYSITTGNHNVWIRWQHRSLQYIVLPQGIIMYGSNGSIDHCSIQFYNMESYCIEHVCVAHITVVYRIITGNHNVYNRWQHRSLQYIVLPQGIIIMYRAGGSTDHQNIVLPQGIIMYGSGGSTDHCNIVLPQGIIMYGSHGSTDH